VIFGYGHINFRKGQGLLLHIRLPVPIEHFYRENKELMKNVGETIHSVIRLLKSKYKIRFKAEHSPGPFHIWLDTDYRKNLRKDIEDGKAFFNPHLEIFDRVLVQKLKEENIPYDNLKAFDEYLPEDLEKLIFQSAIFNYLGN